MRDPIGCSLFPYDPSQLEVLSELRRYTPQHSGPSVLGLRFVIERDDDQRRYTWDVERDGLGRREARRRT